MSNIVTSGLHPGENLHFFVISHSHWFTVGDNLMFIYKGWIMLVVVIKKVNRLIVFCYRNQLKEHR